MDEAQVRRIVQEEVNRQAYQSGAPAILPHNHDDSNSPRIVQSDVMPSVRASGSITFAHTGLYTLNINSNPNPTLVICSGTVVDSVSSPTKRTVTFGTASLGRSYYFQPQTSSSVAPGPLQPFIQSCNYFYVDNNNIVHALTSETHLVDVFFGSIHARMDIVGFTGSTVTINVSNLDSGWAIIVNLVVI